MEQVCHASTHAARSSKAEENKSTVLKGGEEESCVPIIIL
jgi:hypothetical protein